MLDAFTEVLVKQASQKQEEDELTEVMMNLPLEEVSKIASGQLTIKEAYSNVDGRDWLKKYESTPLYDQAIALEEECLALEAADIEQRMADRTERDSMWDKKDMLRLKKRQLDLELHKGGMAGEDDEEEEDEEEELVEAKEASAFVRALEKRSYSIDSLPKISGDVPTELKGHAIPAKKPKSERKDDKKESKEVGDVLEKIDSKTTEDERGELLSETDKDKMAEATDSAGRAMAHALYRIGLR